MLSFATEFPVDSGRSGDDFAYAFRQWLLGSPHTEFTAEELRGDSGTEWERRTAAERLQVFRHQSSSGDAVGFRYTKRSEDLEWVTHATFSKEPDDAWVGLRTSCESRHPASRLPPAKKPILVRVLLEQLHGGPDGALVVGSEPVLLSADDLGLAVNCLSGESNCRLPIVYVSAGFIAGHTVDPQRLAQALSGMAHVLVEPNRAFSCQLRERVGGENVYGGTVGIYWPDGAGRRSFFLGPQFASADEISLAVIEEVQKALTNRRAMHRCTLAAVQKHISRRAIDELRQQGSTNVDLYVQEFDKELEAKREELAGAEQEIQRLKAEVRRYESRDPTGSGLVFAGAERDLFEGEVHGVIREALVDACDRVPSHSRRQHVLRSVVKSIPASSPAKKLRDELKELLRDYRSMDGTTRKILTNMGFEISEEGKHFKLCFEGDQRYTFTLPKSGSDHRGGLNAASDISRRCSSEVRANKPLERDGQLEGFHFAERSALGARSFPNWGRAPVVVS